MASEDSAGAPPAARAGPPPIVTPGAVLAVSFVLLAAVVLGYLAGTAWSNRCPGGYVETWVSPFDMACIEAAPLPR